MRVVVSLMALLVCAAPALAQPACTEPAAPAPIDGAQANADQLRTAMATARDFMAQSELYQSCLTQAADPDAKARIAASQRAQESVGQSINVAVDTYKKTHTD